MPKRRVGADSETWIHAPGIDADSLRAPLGVLALPDRLAAACTAVGASTVAEVLAVQRDDFLAIKGLGRRCWQQLKRAVCRHLHHHRRARPTGPGSSFELQTLGPRARLALVRLGLTTRESLSVANPDALLAIPDLDAAALATLQAALASAPSATVWPARILRASLLRLALPARLRRALADGGCKTIGDLRCADPEHLAALRGVGTAGVRILRSALATGMTLRQSPRTTRRAPSSSGLERMLRGIGSAERRLVEGCLGLHGRRATPAQLAADLNIPLAEMGVRLAKARTALLSRGGSALRRLRAAAAAELQAQGGVLRTTHLPASNPLRTLTGTDADPILAMRLLAFLEPESLVLVGDSLLQIPADVCPRLSRELARVVGGLPLPMPLQEVREHLVAAGIAPLPRGLFEALLQQVPRVQIVVDPHAGERLDRRLVTVTARVEEILRSAPGSLQASDLLFAYRDRFGSARKTRLVDALHAERAFLRVGADEWDLRERHLDELELAQPEADRVRNLIVASDRACALVDLLDPRASARLGYLVRDLLHHDPALRSLGRGVFSGRGHRVSTHVKVLRYELRRAMGEVPLLRFLANQPESVRQVRARLLAENRLFVSSAPDRIDLLTNYPLNEDRMARLLRAVETLIDEAGGYDRLDRLAAKMRTDEGGGSFLTPHLLADLLKRHGRFDILAGDLITTAASRLRHKIQQRVRSVIRTADRALNLNEILAASPDLAEFGTGLTDLLLADPLVHHRDERYCVL